jgi:hypothetical protein
MNFRNPWDFEGEQAAKVLDNSVLESDDRVITEEVLFVTDTFFHKRPGFYLDGFKPDEVLELLYKGVGLDFSKYKDENIFYYESTTGRIRLDSTKGRKFIPTIFEFKPGGGLVIGQYLASVLEVGPYNVTLKLVNDIEVSDHGGAKTSLNYSGKKKDDVDKSEQIRKYGLIIRWNGQGGTYQSAPNYGGFGSADTIPAAIVLYHELAHVLHFGMNDQSKVIDFENEIRMIYNKAWGLNLPIRDYDSEHKKN